jgi:hypothetical protein
MVGIAKLAQIAVFGALFPTMIWRPLGLILRHRSFASYFHSSPAFNASRKVLQKFKLADIGEGITECEVIKWYEFSSGRLFMFQKFMIIFMNVGV